MAAVKESLYVRSDRSGLERMRYFPRQLLTAEDMRAEQEYFREKQRRHNRFLHGSGVVCGLEVVEDAEAGPRGVRICPGYALGPWGDEIYVPEPEALDLAHRAGSDGEPCQPRPLLHVVGNDPVRLLVRIRYAQCPARPQRTLPAGCGCDETACEYARIRDSFEIQCVPKPPLKDPASAPDTNPRHCMAGPDDPWIVLAEVTMQANSPMVIDNTVRPVVANTPGTPV